MALGQSIRLKQPSQLSTRVTSLLRAQFPDDVRGQAKPLLDQNTAEQDGEELSSYIPALMEAVLELHDSGSIPLLYKPEVLTTGRMATSALGYFGHTEASRIIEFFKRAQPGAYKNSLEMTIFSMLHKKTIDSSSLRSEVEAILLRQSYSLPADRKTHGLYRDYRFYLDAYSRNRLTTLASSDPDVFVTYV